MAKVKGRAFKQVYLYRFRGPGGWLVGLTGIVAMLFWNWKLLLATGAGVLVMLMVYLMQEWDWQRYWSSFRRYFTGSNQQLTLAVGSGGIATLSTYMAVSIWIDSDSSWIATGAILQGFGTLATLILLVWQILSRQAGRNAVNRDQMLHDLTDGDPLKRLLAVRQLTRWGTDHCVYPSENRIVAECFRLMLSRERESIIREAVLDGLQVLDSKQILSKGTQPLQVPITLKQTAPEVHRQ